MPRYDDLGDLLQAATDPALAQGPRVERHLWLIALLRWLHGDNAAQRLVMLRQVLQAQTVQGAAVVAQLHRIWREGDAPALFADLGFAPRRGFFSELRERLIARVLPATPDTDDLAALFALALDGAQDADWLTTLPEAELDAWSGLLHTPDAPSWRAPLLQALVWLASAIRAAGFSPLLRRRMDETLLANRPFDLLAGGVQQLRDALQIGNEADIQAAANLLRALLQSSSAAAASVMNHLSANGISVDIVFEVEQLQSRIGRAETLLRCLLAPNAMREAAHLMAELVAASQARRSVRGLVARQYSLLARKVAERSAETGEHYITRTPAEYRGMLRAALGGGSVVGLTTFAKFGVMALGLGAFWAGVWSGVAYALSFLLIHALHWTLATKQPSMTGPALAARLAGPLDEADAQGFAEEVAHLVRSQIAGILGNLGAVIPAVLLVQFIGTQLNGAPPVGPEQATYVLHALTLLGPTALFAAFTGLLLFASSQVAGWAENAFVYRRLDSAIAHNPGIRARLGVERAARWADVARRHVSGVTANVSLGLMLGIVPAVLGFFGLPLDVRHVTLASGQLAAAAGALGFGLLAEPAFWWCVAGIAVTGMLNLGVSFWCAFRVALRARGINRGQRAAVSQALWHRLRQRPLDFVRPPPADTPPSPPATPG